MFKNNWEETLDRFDRWWEDGSRLHLIVADVRRPAPVYSNIIEYSDPAVMLSRHLDFLSAGAYCGDAIPDISAYLGPGSLSTFVGAQPIYSDRTIWYRESGGSLDDVARRCREFLSSTHNGESAGSHWYEWSLHATRFFASEAGGRYVPSMPDLEQNLDILSAVLGPEKILMDMMDRPEDVIHVLELLYLVWERAFDSHLELIGTHGGRSAFTHYNIIGKGSTSVLQSDISCMLSRDMFDEMEMPFLRKQAERLDNVIYHLDGPGSTRHLDSILAIKKIAAVQWVPGTGQPGNSDSCWHSLYDKIVKADKGLYVWLHPWEINGFRDRYGETRLMIRTLADDAEHQKRIVDDFMKA
ncbi:MAG: hypothetical protein R6W99_10760 [Clostridia bacterium]